ncbi:p24 [Lambdina fiscellaria nucleopolyhedrovirus]|uniref:p24 n=1 Tax=Lambdina fiscellaria nucleopolyhedrovirus TaxID=1642929 RepID=A0A0E3URP6_9ABAC|nr:p24 [Lambdina fiscellaria nucleopolyhedrovirus]AKC91649.1 p24 [Lambdina fiscellaria nucleopolyhedrovirus]
MYKNSVLSSSSSMNVNHSANVLSAPLADHSSTGGASNNVTNVAVSGGDDNRLSTRFQYDDEVIEVVVIENGDDDRDGYVEIDAAAKLLTAVATVRGFNKAVLWTNMLPSHKLVRNNRNYVHAFAICRYLSAYNLSNSNHPPQYYILKRLVADLIVGAQSQIVDPIDDIKTRLCSLQECVENNVLINGSAASSKNGNAVYQPTTVPITGGAVAHTKTESALNSKRLSVWMESMREFIRAENAALLSNINIAIDSIKNIPNNFAKFNNDIMVDSMNH